MCPIVPRIFTTTDGDGNSTTYDPGYHNATLGTSGVAIPFPPGASGAVVSVGAGCYIGVRESSTLASFNDDNYGSILNGQPYQIKPGGVPGYHDTAYLHLATWSSTTSVAVVFY